MHGIDSAKLRRLTHRQVIALASFAFASIMISCSDDELTRLRPMIAVDPESLDFGEGIVDFDNQMTLTIINRGSGVLEISAIDVITPAGVYTIGPIPEKISGVSSKPLAVGFVPKKAHEVYDGSLTIHSNDAQKPQLIVPLHGVGGVREIEVFPTEIDFGRINEGTSPRRQIEIRNLGGDPLEISRITWTSTSSDMGIAADTFMAGIIAPKTSTIVEVVYSPIDLGGDHGLVTIYSDDEDEPTVEVTVRGTSNLAPRAIAFGCEKPLRPNQIGCDGAELVHGLTAGFRRIIGLDGRMSYDPDGGPIADYRWVIVQRPASSNAAIFFSTDDITLRKRATGDIEIDRVGSYDLRLIAKDERGLESLDRSESHVYILPRDLEVLLRWDITTDVDLHFVRPGGSVGDYGNGMTRTSTGNDCCAFNRSPNWSDPMSSRDDPSLDKDEVTGRGPEIVSLDSPEDGGRYSAYAHYCDSRMTGANTSVVLEVYVRGELAGTVPANGTGYALLPGELWHAADIMWSAAGPSATVIDLSASAPVSRPGLCLSP